VGGQVLCPYKTTDKFTHSYDILIIVFLEYQMGRQKIMNQMVANLSPIFIGWCFHKKICTLPHFQWLYQIVMWFFALRSVDAYLPQPLLLDEPVFSVCGLLCQYAVLCML
jgi:hypothetical protein